MPGRKRPEWARRAVPLPWAARMGGTQNGGRTHAAAFPRALRTARDAASAAANLKVQGFEVDYVEDYEGRRVGAVRIDGVRLIDNVPL